MKALMRTFIFIISCAISFSNMSYADELNQQANDNITWMVIAHDQNGPGIAKLEWIRTSGNQYQYRDYTNNLTGTITLDITENSFTGYTNLLSNGDRCTLFGSFKNGVIDDKFSEYYCKLGAKGYLTGGFTINN